MRKLLLLSAICVMSQSCQKVDTQLTDVQKQEIIDSATSVVKKVFEYSNNMDFRTGLDHYSGSSDSHFVIDGTVNSLSDLKEAYKEIGPAVEDLHNTIESWNIQVLSPDIVTCTLPVKLRLKLKAIPEFTGQLVWTATLRKQEGRWLIVQSHESWLNCAEVAAALVPDDES